MWSRWSSDPQRLFFSSLRSSEASSNTWVSGRHSHLPLGRRHLFSFRCEEKATPFYAARMRKRFLSFGSQVEFGARKPGMLNSAVLRVSASIVTEIMHLRSSAAGGVCYWTPSLVRHRMVDAGASKQMRTDGVRSRLPWRGDCGH